MGPAAMPRPLPFLLSLLLLAAPGLAGESSEEAAVSAAEAAAAPEVSAVAAPSFAAAVAAAKAAAAKVAAATPAVPAIPAVPAVPAPPQQKMSCSCGIFLSGQLKKGRSQPPEGNPVLQNEDVDSFPNTAVGRKQCTNRCLDIVAKHLPNSAAILCGALDRDCYKERAYLFVKNGDGPWVNTNLSAGREYCCKDGVPYHCPLVPKAVPQAVPQALA